MVSLAKKSHLFLMLITQLLLASCATKFRAPLNRMVDPETVGGALSTEIEVSKQSQLDGKIDVSSDDPYPMKFGQRSDTGYYAGMSLAESVDLTWQHTSSGPSMLGVKWQFMGGSLKQAGAGQAMAVTASFGGNSHEIDGSPKLEFAVSATDIGLIHGLWLTPFWQVFESLSYSSYSFDGKLKGGSTPGEFKDEGTLLTLAAGTGLYFRPFKIKTEFAYTKSDWSGAGSHSFLSWGFSMGLYF